MNGTGALIASFVLFLQISGSFEQGALPKCSKRDPYLGECIRRILSSMKPQLASGMIAPGIQAPFMIDPFYYDKAVLGNGRLKFQITDLTVTGVSNFNMHEVKSTVNDTHLNLAVKVSFPEVKVHCKMNLLNNRISEGVEMWTSMKKIYNEAMITGNFYQKDGVEHLRVVGWKINIKNIDIGEFYMKTRSTSKRELRLLNTFLKYGSQSFVKALYPVIGNWVENFHVDLIDDFFDDFPLSYFLTD